MESDEEQEGVDVTEEFFRQAYLERRSRHGALYGHFQRLVPEQTIIYIQYCLLRVPFLLLYDYSFTDQFLQWIENSFQYSIDVIDTEKHYIYFPIRYLLHSSLFHGLIEMNLLLSIPVLGLILLIFLLLCTDRHLVVFYSYFTSFLVIYFHYQLHRRGEFQLNMILLQVILPYVYNQMLNIRPISYSTLLERRFCFVAPFIFILGRYILPTRYGMPLLNVYYLVWALVHLSEALIDQRQTIFHLMRTEFLNEIIALYQNLGLQTVFGYLQEHIHIVTLLKIFWLTKVVVSPLGFRETYSNPFLNNATRPWNDTTTNVTLALNETFVYNETLSKTVYFTTLYYGTETVFTLISLACIVSYGMKIVSHRLFRLLHLWNEEVEQIGTVIGVMFFLLLFQSNLTRLDLHRRHVPLLKAFSLLTVALCHFLHTILEPQLLKVAMQTMTDRIAFNQMNDPDDNVDDLSDQSNARAKSWLSKVSMMKKILRSYHHRHVYTCLSILIILIFYIILLWRLTTFSTWLLAITAFSLELIVRLTASLAQYTIYVLDAHALLSNIDSFDEYIFRIKAVTSCFEFVLGVFLLFNGFYILCFEARGALRAFMLAIHAYLNIIKNFRRGWQILRNRRSAWDNVNQLPVATEEQIENYDDICAICHNLLTVGNTCITPCGHIFHKKCLQKAFYATQNCALCSRPIVTERTEHQHRE